MIKVGDVVWWRDGNCTPPLLNSSNNRVKAKLPTRVEGRMLRRVKRDAGKLGNRKREQKERLSRKDIWNCLRMSPSVGLEFRLECAQEGWCQFLSLLLLHT